VSKFDISYKNWLKSIDITTKNEKELLSGRLGIVWGRGLCHGRSKDDFRKKAVRPKTVFWPNIVVQRAAFWKSRKSEMAPKSTSGGKIGTETLLKRCLGAVLNKHEKSMKC
jgi:hypothetical protein